MAVAAYLFWAGLFLMLAPWMASWDHNFFVDAAPVLSLWTGNQYVRGAISGVGLVTAAAGVRDIAGALLAKASEEPGKKISTP